MRLGGWLTYVYTYPIWTTPLSYALARATTASSQDVMGCLSGLPEKVEILTLPMMAEQEDISTKDDSTMSTDIKSDFKDGRASVIHHLLWATLVAFIVAAFVTALVVAFLASVLLGCLLLGTFASFLALLAVLCGATAVTVSVFVCAVSLLVLGLAVVVLFSLGMLAGVLFAITLLQTAVKHSFDVPIVRGSSSLTK